MKTPFIILAATLSLSAVALCGVVKLKDGTTLQGDLRRADDINWELTLPSGQKRIIPESDVASIQATAPNAADPLEATERLASLRRTVDAMSDLSQIIQRYESLIKQIDKTPAADQARADLAKWRDYQAQGMIKVGKDWRSPQAIAEISQKNSEQIDKAREQIKAGRLKDALTILDKVLEQQPTEPAAIYLKGYIAFRQDQIPLARKYYDQLALLQPGHGPTLNNLAAVQWRQNATNIAMTNLQKAMAALPQNQTIHDNVAEILNAAKKETREPQALKRLKSQYEQDQPKLEATMQLSGLSRWGATWVTAEKLRELRAQEDQMRAQLDQLSRDFDSTQEMIRRIDDNIAANQRSMNTIDSNSWARDDQGRMVRIPYPSSWYDLQRDIDQLTARRKDELAKLDSLRAQAQEAKSHVSVPPYTGKLQLLDEQFAPGEPRPSTRPTTAPPVKADPLPQ